MPINMKTFCVSKYNGVNYGNDEHICYKMIHNKQTGEEMLKVKEKISIKEQLAETDKIIEAYKELTRAEIENRKAENLIDMQNDEEFMKELEQASETLQDENVYTMLDKMQLIGRIYNNLSKEERENYKTPMNFAKKGLKTFLADYKTSLETKETEIAKTNKELELEIEELKKQLNKETT